MNTTKNSYYKHAAIIRFLQFPRTAHEICVELKCSNRNAACRRLKELRCLGLDIEHRGERYICRQTPTDAEHIISGEL
jgi:hypothetical protein